MSDTRELSEDLTDDDYEVSSIASISSSHSVEKEKSLEDVFKTITPTSPNQTQPSSLSFDPMFSNSWDLPDISKSIVTA